MVNDEYKLWLIFLPAPVIKWNWDATAASGPKCDGDNKAEDSRNHYVEVVKAEWLSVSCLGKPYSPVYAQ